MKLLKTSEDKKQALIETSAYYKKELEGEMKSISKNTERIITNALFIGGALALTYLAVTQLSGSKSKKKKAKHQQEEGEETETSETSEPSKPNIISQVGEIVMTQATMALLEFAKEKLAEYLHSRKSTDENS